MASTPLSKLAYKTLQQGKAIAGLAHKELSTKLMEWVAPEAVPSIKSVTPDLMKDLRSSMAQLEERKGIGKRRSRGFIPKPSCSMPHGLSGLVVTRRSGLISHPHGVDVKRETSGICRKKQIPACTRTITCRIFTIKPTVTSAIIPLSSTTFRSRFCSMGRLMRCVVVCCLHYGEG